MKRTIKDPNVRRNEILKAARKMFIERTYEKATMNELIRRLNIAKGTLYHYFSSKDELLEAVVEKLVDEDLAEKSELLAKPQNRDINALEKLKLLISSNSISNENEELLHSLHSPANVKMHARQLGRHLTKLAPLYAEVFEEGNRQGLFSVEHALETAELLLAGIQYLTDTGFYLWDSEQLQRRAGAFPALIEKQLGTPKGAFSFMNEGGA